MIFRERQQGAQCNWKNETMLLIYRSIRSFLVKTYISCLFVCLHICFVVRLFSLLICLFVYSFAYYIYPAVFHNSQSFKSVVSYFGHLFSRLFICLRDIFVYTSLCFAVLLRFSTRAGEDHPQQKTVTRVCVKLPVSLPSKISMR